MDGSTLELNDLYSSPNIFQVLIYRQDRLGMSEASRVRNAHRILATRPK